MLMVVVVYRREREPELLSYHELRPSINPVLNTWLHKCVYVYQRKLGFVHKGRLYPASYGLWNHHIFQSWNASLNRKRQ